MTRPTFNEATKYRFEGVNDNTTKMWYAPNTSVQVDFNQVELSGDHLSFEGTQFIVHTHESGVAFESVKNPGYFLSQYEENNKTQQHLKRQFPILEQGDMMDNRRVFTVHEPIWNPGDYIDSSAFTIKWEEYVLVTGEGGLELVPYTAIPEKNWGFVFKGLSHTIIVTLSNGTKIETIPFPAMAPNFESIQPIVAANNYGGYTDWRVPTIEEMQAIWIQFDMDSIMPKIYGMNYWTSEFYGPGLQTGIISTTGGIGGISFSYYGFLQVVRSL